MANEENVGLFEENVGLFWENVGLFAKLRIVEKKIVTKVFWKSKSQNENERNVLQLISMIRYICKIWL